MLTWPHATLDGHWSVILTKGEQRWHQRVSLFSAFTLEHFARVAFGTFPQKWPLTRGIAARRLNLFHVAQTAEHGLPAHRVTSPKIPSTDKLCSVDRHLSLAGLRGRYIHTPARVE